MGGGEGKGTGRTVGSDSLATYNGGRLRMKLSMSTKKTLRRERTDQDYEADGRDPRREEKGSPGEGFQPGRTSWANDARISQQGDDGEGFGRGI